MNRRQLWWFLLIAIVLTVLSIFLIDQPVAAFVQRAGGRESKFLQEGTHWLEVASGFPITRYFLGYLLLGAAALLFIAKSTRLAAWILLFIGSTHIVTRLVAGGLKNVFHRLRPFEVIQAGNWDWKFFGDQGSSFPSGHSAHFWSLFLPLLFLFPRYRLPLLVVPVFITIARVGVNDHWCSDVIASAGLAALFTLAFLWLFRMQRSEPDATPEAGRLTTARVIG
ncbi:MAG TPA: phosphatase PAP2 family protein [Chthoniobacterales bacterium]|nr:phosphatase PAP2 family protein [Chthoniobacterales bacterium]